jgi:hypothetical protein
MIALSRPFTLRHPWWSIVFLTLLGMLFILLALLPVWGWVEMRFSPVQRFYLPVYLQSTVGVLQGSGPEYVEWIERRAPGKAWEIADAGDLVPVKEGTAPFELSKAALSQGWTELGYATRGTYQQQETRDYLEANVFGGNSLLFLVLQPFELVLIGWMCWKFFDSWRNNLARKRGLHWDPQYVPHTLGQDLELFTKQIIQEVKATTIQARNWLAPKHPTAAMSAVFASGSVPVSPSETVRGGASTRKEPELKAASPSMKRAVEVTPDQRPKPTPPVVKPSQSPALKSPSSPFGKPPAHGEPERKWDVSQWIE